MVVRNDPDDNFRAVLCDTKTGLNVTEAPVISPKWGMRLNGPGPVSGEIPIDAREARKLDLRNGTMPLRRSLGIMYGEHLLECGPILQRSYNPETGRLSLVGSGIWSVLNRRKLILAAHYQQPQNVIPGNVYTIGPLGRSGIQREILRSVTLDNPYASGTAGNLNLVLDAVSEAGSHTRDYWGYDLPWAGAALTQLTEGGVDMRLRPRFVAGAQTRVEWLHEHGTEAQPLLKQAGPPWKFDGTVKNSPVVGFGGDEDASEVAARSWRVGAGQERETKIGVATDTTMVDLGMPWTEVDTADKQQTRTDLLSAGAASELTMHFSPRANISVTVRADMYPTLGMYFPGDYAAVVIPEDNPIYFPGPRACRILAVDGDDRRNVRLTLAPFLNGWQGSPVAARMHISPQPQLLLGADADLGPDTRFY